MKNAQKLAGFRMPKFDSLDALINAAAALPPPLHDAPVLFEFANPLARFPCKNREMTALSAAQSLRAFSGMPCCGFMRDLGDGEGGPPLGPALRFFGVNEAAVSDFAWSLALRQRGSGFTDQVAQAACALRKRDFVFQFAPEGGCFPVYSAAFRVNKNKLDMAVSAGCLEKSDLLFNYVPVFSFLLQIMSELAGAESGVLQFTACGVCENKKSGMHGYTGIPITPPDMPDFKYPAGNLTLRDLDALFAIMFEYVSRLDAGSLVRANPFEGDSRVQMWSDYANVFRLWKAEKLEAEIDAPHFFHPQLRFIYTGEIA